MDIAKLKVEIDATGAARNASLLDQQLRTLGSGAGVAVGAIKGVSGALLAMGGVVKGLLTTMAPLIALFGAFRTAKAATGTIADFEEQLARLKGITGATTGELQDLEDVARRLGASTRFSAVQAGQGLEYLALAGFSVSQAVTALPATLNLATVGAMDLGVAADHASNILGQFSMRAAQTERVVDVLTKTSQSSNTSVEQLAQAMSFVGTVAGAANISIEETGAALGVLADRGLQGARGGTNLRMAILRLLDPTSQATRELSKLGLTLEDVDPTANSLTEVFGKLGKANLSLASANTIFGLRTAAAGLTLAQMSKHIGELTEKNLQAAGSAQSFSDILNNTLKGATYGFISAVQELFLQMGDRGLLGVLRQIVDFSTEVVRALGGQRVEFSLLNDIVDYTVALFDELPPRISAAFSKALGGAQTFSEGVTHAFSTISTFTANVGMSLEKALGSPVSKILEVIAYGLNKVIRVSEAAVFAFMMLGKTLMVTFEGALQAMDEYNAGNTTAALKTLRQTTEALEQGLKFSAGVFNFSMMVNQHKDYVGDAFKTGKEWGASFIQGVKDLLSGNFDFADTLTKRVAANRAKTAEEAAAEQKRADARLAAAAADGAVSFTGAVNTESEAPTSLMTRASFISKSKVLNTLNDEVRLIGLSNDARERAKQLADLQTEAEEAFGERLADNDPIIESFIAKLNRIRDAERLQETADSIGDAFGSAFEDIILGTKSVEDAFKDMVQSIMKEVVQQSVTKPIASGISSLISGFASNLFSGGSTAASTAGTPSPSGSAWGFNTANLASSNPMLGSANGNAFYQGRLIPFKDGGIFTTPTAFPMAGDRTGVMGEAGPEAVMPLQRGADGKLGVKTSGQRAQPVQMITVNISTPNPDSFRRSGSMIRQALKQQGGL